MTVQPPGKVHQTMKTARIRPRLLLLYAPTLRTSGVATFTAGLCRIMEHHGWEVIVGLAWGTTYHDPRLFEEQHLDVKTIWMDARTGSEEGRIQAICRTIREARPQVVLHSCLDSAFAAVRRLRSAGRGDFTFCVVNHGSFPEHAASLLANRDVVDQVVCVSRWSYLALTSAGVALPGDRVHYIPNTVSSPTAPARTRQGSPPRIGYAGRLMPDKRFRDIFPFFRAVAAGNPATELWIAGDGPYADETRHFCGEFPGRVRHWGAVSREDLYTAFYPEIDIFINFSGAEGWSLAIGEAMAHGVVPVLSAFSGIFVEGLAQPNRTALILPTGDTDSAARLVGALLDNPDQLLTMSAEIRDLMTREYPMALFARRWAETLDGFLSSPQLQPISTLTTDSRSGLESARERLRRLLRRRFPHRDPGGEWPHFSSKKHAVLVAEIAGIMAGHERRAREQALSRMDTVSPLAGIQLEVLACRQPGRTGYSEQ